MSTITMDHFPSVIAANIAVRENEDIPTVFLRTEPVQIVSVVDDDENVVIIRYRKTGLRSFINRHKLTDFPWKPEKTKIKTKKTEFPPLAEVDRYWSKSTVFRIMLENSLSLKRQWIELFRLLDVTN